MANQSSVASVVLNFDELAEALIDYLKNGIQVNLSGINISTSNMEQLLADIKDKVQGINYNDLIVALTNLGAKLDAFATSLGILGTEQVIGTTYKLGAVAEATIEVDLGVEGYLTGITFFQSAQAFDSEDNFDLFIEDDTETQIFRSVYPKGFGEHKYMNVFFRVSKNAKVKILYHNISQTNKVLWLDFHMIDISSSSNGGV